MTLESKLQALVARLEGCSEWSSTPDEIADELKALLAERQPACISYPDCDGDLEGEPHSAKCLATALAERQEPPVSVETVLQWLRKQGAIYGALPSVTGDGIAEAIEQHFALTMVKEKR